MSFLHRCTLSAFVHVRKAACFCEDGITLFYNLKIFLYVWMFCLHIWLCTTASLVSREVRRGCWIPWDQSYRCSWAAMCPLEQQPALLTAWTVSPVSGVYNHKALFFSFSADDPQGFACTRKVLHHRATPWPWCVSLSESLSLKMLCGAYF